MGKIFWILYLLRRMIKRYLLSRCIKNNAYYSSVPKIEHEPNSCGTDVFFVPSPLRVHGKVVILQRETQIGFGMD